MAEKRICSLCSENKELHDSHIIPSFVITWLKNSSATGFLRTADNPNDRFQDYHEKLLCSDCEQHFGTYEGWFGGNIFHPYQRDEKNKFECEDWLHKFIVSVSWRLIICERFTFDELPDYSRTAVNDAKRTWYQILQKGNQDTIDPYSHYMIPLDDLKLNTSDKDLPSGWDFYTDRAIDAGVLHEKQTFVYFKFPNIAFFSFIQPPDVSGIRSENINNSKKVTPPHRLSSEWESFLIERAKLATGQDISERQSGKIKEKLFVEEDEEEPPETFETFSKEMSRKMKNHSPIDYLGEKCPVCGTNHKNIEILPNKPLNKSEMKNLEHRFEFVQGVYLVDKLPLDTASDQMATSLVLSKESMTYLLTLYPDEGWIVENEFNHGNEEDPAEVGQWVYENTVRSYEEWLGTGEQTE